MAQQLAEGAPREAQAGFVKIMRTVGTAVELVSPGDLLQFYQRCNPQCDGVSAKRALRFIIRKYVQYANATMAIWAASVCKIIDGETFKRLRNEKYREYGKFLPDCVRGWVHKELQKARNNKELYYELKHNLRSTPPSFDYKKDAAVAINKRGVKIWREGDDTFVRLTLLPKLQSYPEQPVFKLVPGSMFFDNRRRGMKVLRGEAAFIKDVYQTFNDVIEGRLPCLGVHLLFDTEKKRFELRLITSIKIAVKDCLEGIVGIVFIDREGFIKTDVRIAKPYEEDEAVQLQAHSLRRFMLPIEAWQYLVQRTKNHNMRVRKLQHMCDRVKFGYDKLKEVRAKEAQWRDHQCNKLANAVASWVYQNNLETLIVYDNSGRTDLRILPVYNLAHRTAMVLESLGIPVKALPVHGADDEDEENADEKKLVAAKCPVCNSKFKVVYNEGRSDFRCECMMQIAKIAMSS